MPRNGLGLVIGSNAHARGQLDLLAHRAAQELIERLARGLSQTALANQLGVTFQQVQKYEKGVNRVGAGRLTKIAAVLGIEVGAFFGAKDGADAAAAKERGESSPLKLLTVSGAFRLLRAYGDIANFTVQFGSCHQRRDRIEDDDIERV